MVNKCRLIWCVHIGQTCDSRVKFLLHEMKFYPYMFSLVIVDRVLCDISSSSIVIRLHEKR